MKTLWRKNQENYSDRISHAWAPLNISVDRPDTSGFAYPLCVHDLWYWWGRGGEGYERKLPTGAGITYSILLHFSSSFSLSLFLVIPGTYFLLFSPYIPLLSLIIPIRSIQSLLTSFFSIPFPVLLSNSHHLPFPSF
jgi:hypothetical protein